MILRMQIRNLFRFAVAMFSCALAICVAAQQPASKEDLSAVATFAYKTLSAVPTRGLDASASDIEKIIADHKRLAQSQEARERYLSVIMADDVAYALFYVLGQADYSRRGIQERVSPPVVPFEKATAIRLWKENMPKFEPLVQKILKEQRSTSDTITTFAVENSSTESVLNGRMFERPADDAASQRMRQAVRSRYTRLLTVAGLPISVRKDPSTDEQLVYALTIWQAFRDLSVIIDLYEKDGLPGEPQAIKDAVKGVLAQYPAKRVDDGMKNSPFKIWSTYSHYYPEETTTDPSPMGPIDEYELKLGVTLAPFMDDTSVLPEDTRKGLKLLNR